MSKMNKADGDISELRVRVYFEDTDAGGVVYYANYLRYLERGRTEWLRELGFEQQSLLEEAGVGFLVRKVVLHYRFPARLDDELTVCTRLLRRGRATVVFGQEVVLSFSGKTVVDGTVEVACVEMSRMRPVPIPPGVRERLDRVALA